MSRYFIFVYLFLFTSNVIGAQSLDGHYDSLHHLFIPKDSRYGTSLVHKNRFGAYSYFGKQGLVFKNGQKITEPIYDEVLFFEKSNAFAIGIIQGKKGQMTNLMRFYLIPVDSPEKRMEISMSYEFPGSDLEQHLIVVKQGKRNAVIDVEKGIWVVPPTDAVIRLVEPYGYLVSGQPKEDKKNANRELHSHRMNDTLWFAYYDSNFVQKTEYHFSDVKGIRREPYFRTISRYGKGLLDSTGRELLPPYFDHADVVWGSSEFLKAEFDGMPEFETVDEDGFPGVENSKVQLYRRDGSLLSKDTFKAFRGFDESMQWFMVTRSGQYDFILPTDNYEIVPATPLGYVKNSKMNLMDTQGHFVLKEDVDRIEILSRGYFLLEDKLKFSIFNGRTKTLIPIQEPYRYVYERNGFILASNDDKKYLLDSLGKVFGHTDYEDITTGDEFAILKKENKVFVIDSKFKILIPAGKYDEISMSRGHDTLFKVGISHANGMRYGIINGSGKIRVPIEYEKVEVDSDPRFSFFVKQKGKYGLINHLGKMVLPIRYDQIHGFNDHYNRIELVYQGQFCYADTLGHMVASTDGFAATQQLWNGMKIAVNKKGEKKLLNPRNEEVIKVPLESVEAVAYSDVFIVKTNKKFALYTGGGYELLSAEWDSLYYDYSYRKLIGRKHGRNYLLSLDGRPLNDQDFEQLMVISDEGKTAFQYKGKTGLMNYEGRVLIPANYEQLSVFDTNSYMVKKDRRFVLMNEQEQALVDSSSTYFIHRGSFILSPLKPCYAVYLNSYKKIEGYCIKEIQTNLCGNYQLQTDSGYCVVDSNFRRQHQGYFDHIQQYRCEDPIILVSKNGKQWPVNDHYEPLCKENLDWARPYLTLNRYVVKKDGKYGFLSSGGHMILPIQYDSVEVDEAGKRVKVMVKPNTYEWYNLDGKKME